jgi:transposase
MMGLHQSQNQLFSYRVNLEHRVRRDHPLRRVAAVIDFTFVRAEVARFYGRNGNVGVDPVVLLKLMFLLFFDNVASERELMERLPERLDYLWFLGYGLEDSIPDHSVLSKARRRWGQEVFEKVFVQTVRQCVEAGLVDGSKIHVDSSLVAANASKDSVVKSSPELIAAYKQAYDAQESKLQNTTTPEHYESVNDRMVSTTDPDAALVRKGSGGSRPRYHHHRAIDDAQGVITAVETTPGSIAENKKLMDLVEQHQSNTRQKVETVVGDSKYGTAENLAACVEAGLVPHLGEIENAASHPSHRNGHFDESHFTYDSSGDVYRCPAGQTLARRRFHQRRRTWEYGTAKGVCAACPLRSQCTGCATGRSVQRHEQETQVALGRKMARSAAARRDRRRRQYLLEGSFAQAANEHGFKRSRWRRLWRQEIQDWLIATVQNIKILLKATEKRVRGAASMPRLLGLVSLLPGRLWDGCNHRLRNMVVTEWS